MVRLGDFKSNSQRLLSSGHPLLRILANVPDELSVEELRHRIPDWIALLSEE
jgi:hypothetical protein